ncbi:DUF3626 domain-containing protein [Streptomyces scopuliridis]|uniref:DUF3626 domain-containing protein n=1 Tax=Streptomyces scopuliridis TaxID=452529 RepID=UPI0035D64D6C
MTATDARLTSAQLAALRYVRTTGAAGSEAALARIGGRDALALISRIRAHARITLNFHPDRLLSDGATVAESMARDGRYRSQYETGLSNGSRTAVPGGDRDRWEERFFGGAYHLPGVRPADRPTYGAVNLYGHPDGASPRFGSCHVRLRPEVNVRATYSHGDSHAAPGDVGTIDAFSCVLAGLLEERPDAAGAIARLPYDTTAAGATTASGPPGRALDEYVEAQVHGGIDLASDAEALVLDPSFRGTRTARLLTDLARRSRIAVEWHGGFVLAPEEVNAEFRGPVMVPLAAQVCRAYARTGTLDAEVLGHAAASAVREPGAWAEWGTQDEVLQYIKQLWHVLVRYGRYR